MAARRLVRPYRAFKSRLRIRLGRSVALARAIHHVRHSQEHDPWTGEDTELVIDGFPRCGNTYAAGAVLHANPGLRLSHHTHNAANVVDGVRRGLPVVVVVRDPVDACVSLAQREPDLPEEEALRWYRDFHRRLLPVRGNILVASFDEFVADPGWIVDRVNERFGTAFRRYEKSAESERLVEAWIDSRATKERGSRRFDDLVARPSSARSAARDPLVDRINAQHPGLVRECHDLLVALSRG